MILAIDPGSRPGYAILDAESVRQMSLTLYGMVGSGDLCAVSSIVVEEPLRPLKMTMKKYTRLCMTAGAQAALAESGLALEEGYFSVPANAWKGGTPKHISNKRVRATLTPEELTALDKFPKSRQPDVLDAIGLGKWFRDQTPTKREKYRVELPK